jgi:hypothetical protein
VKSADLPQEGERIARRTTIGRQPLAYHSMMLTRLLGRFASKIGAQGTRNIASFVNKVDVILAHFVRCKGSYFGSFDFCRLFSAIFSSRGGPYLRVLDVKEVVLIPFDSESCDFFSHDDLPYAFFRLMSCDSKEIASRLDFRL